MSRRRTRPRRRRRRSNGSRAPETKTDAVSLEKLRLPAHAGPFKTTLSLTANEIRVIHGALELALADYRARHLPRKHAYVERAYRLIEKVDLAMAETQSMTTDLTKAMRLVETMPAEDRNALLDFIDRFCPDCGQLDEAGEHEGPCLRGIRETRSVADHDEVETP